MWMAGAVVACVSQSGSLNLVSGGSDGGVLLTCQSKVMSLVPIVNRNLGLHVPMVLMIRHLHVQQAGPGV